MSSVITFIILVIVSIPIAIFVCWTAYSLEDKRESSSVKELMEDWNYFKWIAFGVPAILSLIKSIYGCRPKSPIDKEIAEEEKEIAELEQQKEKMDKLEELKRRKERLFEEAQESEVEREEVLVICDSCGNYMDYLGIDRPRREVYECKGCNHTLKVSLCTN